MKLYSEKQSNVYLIVGLGNPGPAYANNRHNLGFMVLDSLARSNAVSWKLLKGTHETGQVRLSDQTVFLLKPLTFMNVSGRAVANFTSRKFVDFQNIVVVHDDMDLGFGKIRLKRGGGDGGHRGVRSIVDSLRFKDFIRIRMGVGRPPEGVSAEAYVLDDFREKFERENIEQLVSNGVSAVMSVISMGLEKAQQKVSLMSLSLTQTDMSPD